MKSVKTKNKSTLNAIEIILFAELKQYKNVFFIEEIDKLSSSEESNYVINIIAESFYESLYNLFNTELVILRKYFNDALAKNELNILLV